MIELIALVAALIGSTAGAAYDLRTTEIPDGVFYVMIAIGITLAVTRSCLAWSVWPAVTSALVCLGFFVFGFLMYKAGQWGGADVFLLASIGLLVPELPAGFSPRAIFPFPLSFIFNLFLIGAPYMLIYALVIALSNKNVLRVFFNDMKASCRLITLSSIVLFIIFVGLSLYLSSLLDIRMSYLEAVQRSLLPVFMTIGFFIVWKFAKAVEDIGFKKRIPVSKLKVGDILNEWRELRGVTKQELKKIKRSRKRYVVIKEGVRFAPSFVLALVFTLYYGDAIFLFLRFWV